MGGGKPPRIPVSVALFKLSVRVRPPNPTGLELRAGIHLVAHGDISCCYGEYIYIYIYIYICVCVCVCVCSMFHPGPEECRTDLKAFKISAALVCRDVRVLACLIVIPIHNLLEPTALFYFTYSGPRSLISAVMSPCHLYLSCPSNILTYKFPHQL